MTDQSILFWAIAITASLFSAGLLLRPVLRGNDAPAARPDIDVYRDQLAEVDSDLARGVITEAEAEALRTEVKRRLLAAADTSRTVTGRGAVWPAVLVTGIALTGGLVAYAFVGEPARPDRPLALRIAEAEAARANRPSQAEAEAFIAQNAQNLPPVEVDEQHVKLLSDLRTILAQKPNLTGQRMLARNLAMLQKFSEAREAQQDALELAGEAATAKDHVDLAEYMILAANGYVSPEAEAALRQSLKISPQDPRSRYYSGLLAAQSGRPDLTWNLWTRLLQEGPADAPWNQAIRGQLPEIAETLGLNASGPSAEDIEAASDMPQQDRAAMIEAMVDGLAERLSQEGGPPEDWARLIRARAVQGRTEQANAIWQEAQSTFADNPDGLALINQTAEAAGLAE
ncbi:c-type cytochrome biogenesis protein CcmI [Halovulum sp. GXIMD14793]